MVNASQVAYSSCISFHWTRTTWIMNSKSCHPLMSNLFKTRSNNHLHIMNISPSDLGLGLMPPLVQIPLYLTTWTILELASKLQERNLLFIGYLLYISHPQVYFCNMRVHSCNQVLFSLILGSHTARYICGVNMGSLLHYLGTPSAHRFLLFWESSTFLKSF